VANWKPNEGFRRLSKIVGFVVGVLAAIALFRHAHISNAFEGALTLVIGFIVFYFTAWALVRAIAWVIDGFKKKD
jgi:hypothetical protein